MQSVFLGWDRPLLPTTADYLLRRYTIDGRLDLSRVVLTLPGRRAIHRLEELLAERVEADSDRGLLDPDWYPPEFLTLGTLPERFYELDKPIADGLTQQLAWIRAVDQLEDENPDLLRRLIPHPPKRSDQDARLSLGKMFASLHREIAADALDFAGIARLCETWNVSDEAQRWQVLAAIREKYLRLLDALDVWDLQSARLFAIERQTEDEYDKIAANLRKERMHFFLVGLVDMNRAPKRILEKFSEFVTPLVFAPETLRDRFDSFGCLLADRWADLEIPVDDDQIHVAANPVRQADVVLRKIADLHGRFSASEIVVGVPDPQVIPPLEQRFEQAGIATRHFEGTPMRQTAVYRFLEAVLAFVETNTFRSLAELIRHPDVERALRRSPAFPPDGIDPETGRTLDPITEMDRYYSEFLPSTVGGDWKTLTDEENPWRNRSFQTLDVLWNCVRELLGVDLERSDAASARKRPAFWMRQIEAILERLYAGNENRLVVEAEKPVRDAASTIGGIPKTLLPDISFENSLRLILRQLESGNIPPLENDRAVELIGWLEIVMDDAPIVFVTGMNDGFVPSFLTSDLFLPDKIRRHLGIEDNRRRFARDAYALSVLLRSRRHDDRRLEGSRAVHLIAGRRSAEGDPLLPSRLFFASDSETVARRVRRFFTPIPEESKLILSGTSHPGQEHDSAFRAPRLDPPEKRIHVMRVTEFSDYLRCPYRYYLKNRLHLDNCNDAAEELGAGEFGTLIHHVLKRFGRSAVRNSVSPEAIRDFFTETLRETVAEKYGPDPRPAVAIQVERALERLRAFAGIQAAWREAGRSILETEFAFDEKSHDGNIFLEVDGRKMFLRGRIDRIDVEDKTGRLIVLDYKTSDSAAEPDKTHRKKGPDGRSIWIDFQLPLYRYLLRKSGFQRDVRCGYAMLPKDSAKTDFSVAAWDEREFEEAIDQAREIVRRIWNNEFPMTEPPPRFSEPFAAICLDDVVK